MRQPLLAFSGGGMFFFWQLGAGMALKEHFNLEEFEWSGASAGALTALILASGADPRKAVRSACDAAKRNNLYARPLGCVGVFRKILEKWLWENIPENLPGAEKISIIAYQVFPCPGPVVLQGMQSREELISAALASCHVPFLIDWSLWARFRGRALLDGLKLCSRAVLMQREERRDVIYVQAEKDPWVRARKTFVDLRLRSEKEIEEMIEKGHTWMTRQISSGAYAGVVALHPQVVRRDVKL